MVALADAIYDDLRPGYYVEVGTRTYKDVPDIVVPGDLSASQQSDAARKTTVALKQSPVAVTLPMPVEIKQRYLEIRAVSDDTVITVIELLSPANKRRGKGRDTYETKRLDVLGSASHLVEIDLLRNHPTLPMDSQNEPSDYYILVSITRQRPHAQLYPFGLQDIFPTFPIPLQHVNESIAVDLQSIFSGVIDRASYDTRIDYTRPVPPPSLSAENQIWAQNLLKKHEN